MPTVKLDVKTLELIMARIRQALEKVSGKKLPPKVSIPKGGVE